MLDVAHNLGWLSSTERRDELVRMLGELLAREAIAGTDVDLACTLNKDHVLDGALGQLDPSGGRPDDVGHAAIRACLGSAEAHARVLMGLASPADADVRIAQVYLHHRPIADVNELRAATAAIARMSGSEAQVRALDVLAPALSLGSRKPGYADATLFQDPILAGPERDRGRIDPRRSPVDRRSAAAAQTARRPPEILRPGDNMVDALIRRLQLP